MDFYYMGDCMSFTKSFLRDFEKFPVGTLEKNCLDKNSSCSQNKPQKCKTQEKSKKKQKQECQFCKEQKKRPLTAYVKKRNNMQRYDSICEEIEEDESQDVQDCPDKSKSVKKQTNK